MPVIGPRLRKLQMKVSYETREIDRRTSNAGKLLAIRVGPGALKLPKDVSRLHLRFAAKSANGHMGPRKFWHHELVRLKFHNPAVSFTTDRSLSNEEEPSLVVFFAPKDAAMTSGTDTGAPSATSSTSGDKVASDHSPFQRTETIWVRDSYPKDILENLIRLTKAEPIEPSNEDTQLLVDLAEQNRRSQISREQNQAVAAERKRQEDILAEARGLTA